MRITRRLLLLGLTLLAAFACLEAAGPPRAALAQTSSLTWSACDGQFECAKLSVPLDYAQPAGRHIGIALIRAPARKPSERIGALLANPGGPGASGNEFMRAWSGVVDAGIRDRFDLVGFDPRGVGDSTPLLCHDDIKRLLALDPEPVTADEWAEVQSVTQQFVDLCQARGGDLLPHLGSLDVVRDMDRIREALGEAKLTFVGYSYGTVLGALYAEAFPTHVRAIVLDGPVDLSLLPDDLNVSQAVGFERALDHFLEDCRQRGCELARNGRDPGAAIDELFARVRVAPIPSRDADRPAGPGEALTGVLSALYRKSFWSSLSRAVQAGLDGDGSWLVQMTDSLWGRRGSEYDNSLEMNAAVNCLDYAYAHDAAHYRALAARAATVAPRFGAALGSSGLLCGLWPAAPQPIGVPDAAGAPPLLVVGTTGDPATPYEWALATRRDLVPAVLLTFEGEGHTAYASGNRCIDNIVNAYLLTLATPEDGTTCGAAFEPRPPATPVAFPPRSAGTPQPAATASEAAEATATPDGSKADSDSTSTAPLFWGSVAVLGMVLVVGAVVLARRSRRRPQ